MICSAVLLNRPVDEIVAVLNVIAVAGPPPEQNRGMSLIRNELTVFAVLETLKLTWIWLRGAASVPR
jgi:hypothetical protein